jgi:hypothetical protein
MGLFEGGELYALALGPSEGLFKSPLQGAGDEAMLGLAGVELAPRALGLELGALHDEA